MMTNRIYTELVKMAAFEDRYEYLKLGGSVGSSTFGFDRYINQAFYKSKEWRSIRDIVIVRDQGCDLGVIGYEIRSELLVHHINPMCLTAIIDRAEWVLDPRYLITTTKNTHNAIHYGDASLLTPPMIQRQSGDTRLW